MFFSQIGMLGGPAPVRRFLPHLIDLVLERKIEPGTFPVEGVDGGSISMLSVKLDDPRAFANSHPLDLAGNIYEETNPRF